MLRRLLGALAARLFPGAAARRAVAAFCTPAPRPRRRASDRDDCGARRERLRVGRHRVCVYRWGEPAAQPYVLLVHGWGGQALQFRPWLAGLRTAGYAVVAFDQPAHGRSTGRRASLRDVVASLQAVAARFGPAAAVVGHARGGLAATIALRRGLPAARAILIAAEADPDAALRRFARRLGLPPRVHAGAAALLARGIGGSVGELQAHRLAAAIGPPALVVHDLQDPAVPWDEGERYARHWPAARLLSTRGLGHEAIAEDQRVIADCLRFLRGEVVGERVVSSPNLPFGVA